MGRAHAPQLRRGAGHNNGNVASKGSKAMRLQGKSVLVTGGTDGIGLALARALRAKGASVIVCGRDPARIERARGEGFEVIAAELSTDAGRDVLVEAMATRPIDILINNAGVSQRSLALDTDFDVYRTIMEIDFFAPLRLTQLVLPAMVARGSGAIVNNASVAGKVGSPLRTGYCAAKHAMVGWSDALRAEIAQYGVSVHVVTPGFVATGIAANALKGDGSINGPSDDPVNAGISIDEAAAIILTALAADVPEIPVGRDGAPELALLDLKRSNPEQLFAVMSGMAPKVPRN